MKWAVLALLFLVGVSLQAGLLLDSPLRNRDPYTAKQMEDMVFGVTFEEIDLDSECHVDVDMLWMATLGTTPLTSAPMIGDFRNDGQKEIVIATGREYIEVLEGEDGTKEPGWPYYIPERMFAATPVDYDLMGGSVRDLAIATTEGEIIFLSEGGFPYHGATLRVPSTTVDRDWYIQFAENDQTLYLPLYTELPSRADRIKQCETQAAKFAKHYQDLREQHGASHNVQTTEEEYMQQMQQVLLNHIQTQEEKVRLHQMKLQTAKQAQRRTLQGFEGDDDLEDERGARFDRKPVTKGQKKESLYAFNGVQGWLTEQGVESLELFLPTEMGPSFVSSMRTTANLLYSPQEESYRTVFGIKENKDPKIISLHPHIVGSPVIADLEGDGHNELIVSVNFSPDANLLVAHPRRYAQNAIVAFDMAMHQVKWISYLELSSVEEDYAAQMVQAPTVVDLDGDGELNIIVATAMGQIHVLDNYGIPIPGFPISGMGPISAPVVAEDVDQDGKLDLIAIDLISNIALYSRKGTMKWNLQLTAGCGTAPAIADINDDGTLDIVVSCTSGAVHVIDAVGKELRPFPVLHEPGLRGSPTLMKMGDNEHFHVITMSATGHLYLTDGKDACTEVVDIGLGAGARSPMVLADDVTGDGMMNLIVSTGFRFVYCLSTDTRHHPLNEWTSASHKRNVYTSSYHQGIFISEGTRDHRDITGDEFLLQFEIVDNRQVRDNAFYDVQVKLKRELDPLFAGRFMSPGLKTVSIPVPKDRMVGMLRIEMTNEHQQYFTDSISLSFNVFFYRSIKWIITLPLIICSVFVFFLREEFVEMLF